jgi:hypothetical protein
MKPNKNEIRSKVITTSVRGTELLERDKKKRTIREGSGKYSLKRDEVRWEAQNPLVTKGKASKRKTIHKKEPNREIRFSSTNL